MSIKSSLPAGVYISEPFFFARERTRLLRSERHGNHPRARQEVHREASVSRPPRERRQANAHEGAPRLRCSARDSGPRHLWVRETRAESCKLLGVPNKGDGEPSPVSFRWRHSPPPRRQRKACFSPSINGSSAQRPGCSRSVPQRRVLAGLRAFPPPSGRFGLQRIFAPRALPTRKTTYHPERGGYQDHHSTATPRRESRA